MKNLIFACVLESGCHFFVIDKRPLALVVLFQQFLNVFAHIHLPWEPFALHQVRYRHIWSVDIIAYNVTPSYPCSHAPNVDPYPHSQFQLVRLIHSFDVINHVESHLKHVKQLLQHISPLVFVLSSPQPLHHIAVSDCAYFEYFVLHA